MPDPNPNPNPNPNPADWRAALPPELRDAPALKDTKDIAGLAKQFVDVQTHLGNSIRIPGENAGEADVKAFHEKLVQRVPGLYYFPKEGDEQATAALFEKLGRPKEPKDYEVVVPKDGTEVPGFRDVVHKNGLTKAQVKNLSEWFSGLQSGQAEQQMKAHTAEVAKLDAEWGAAKPQKIAAIVALAAKTGAPAPMIEAIQKGTMPPAALRWYDSMVKAIGTEGTNLTVDKNLGPVQLTPSEAEKQIDEIMARKEYREKTPLGQSLRDKVQELAKVAWPG